MGTITTDTASSESLRAEQSGVAAEREGIEQSLRSLALRRVSGDMEAEAEAIRLQSRLRGLDERLALLDLAIGQAEEVEALERATAFERETRRLEAEAKVEEHALLAQQERLAGLASEVRTLVKAIAVQQASYTSHLHVIYNRRGIDRSDLALSHKPHRMLGGDAAAMLSENWLRQVLAEAKHQRRTEEKEP